MSREIFLSYSRTDRDTLLPLLRDLERHHHRVWMDEQLEGGQKWWDEVLRRIRESDAVIIALSPASLESTACQFHVRYAQELGKPVLPVMVRRVKPDLVPEQLGREQIVDYTRDEEQAAFDLVVAIESLPQPRSLPDPLPTPPPVPVSYLSGLSEIIHRPQLALEEQHRLVQRFRAGLQRPRDRDGVIELIRKFRERDDLYAAPSRELDDLDAHVLSAVQPPSVAPPSALGRDSSPSEVSYFSGLGEIIRRPALTLDEQQWLVERLRAGLERDRDGVIELIRELRERDDLFAAPSRKLDELYTAALTATPHVSSDAAPTTASSIGSSPSRGAASPDLSTVDTGSASIAAMAARIFISYRRAEAEFPAEMLYRQLAEHFGKEQVFKDVDSIALGDDFAQIITEAVGSCDAFIALIGDRWLTITGDDGNRRLDDPNDLVRIEVEAALARNIPVIPILLGTARMPQRNQLPPTIGDLVKRNGLELRATDFKEQVSRRLIGMLEQTLTVAAARRARGVSG